MPHEQLDNLVKIGKLKAEAPSAQEVAGLIGSGRVWFPCWTFLANSDIRGCENRPCWRLGGFA